MGIMKCMLIIILLPFLGMADGAAAQITSQDTPRMYRISDLNKTRTGTFLGMKYAGVDITYLPANSLWYIGGYMSALLTPGMRADHVSRFNYAGLTFGRHFYLNDPDRYRGDRPGSALVVGDERSRFIFYAKLGTGAGLGFAKELNRAGTYAGLHGQGVLGVMKTMSGNGSIYLELGSYVQCVPAYSNMRFSGGPNVTIGFQFAGSRI